LITIDPRAAQKIQPELLSDETLHWAGMPNPRVIFHSDDWTAIPFSLLWGGFAIFWEGGVLGYWGNSKEGIVSPFMVLWGIPFVLCGQYMIWGRFLHDAWLKRRTYYAVTNRRVVALQEGSNRKLSTVPLEAIPSIESEEGENGTLWFGPKYPLVGSRGSRKRGMSRFSVEDVTVFADIAEARNVRQLVWDLRAKRNALAAKTAEVLSYPTKT
jgi:hypothetical protein